MPTDKPQATIEEIRKRVPDRITDAEGGHYLLEDIDKIALSKIDAWSDDELEQCLYIMTPLADVADQAQEMKDLLKYLGMDKRVYTLMFGVPDPRHERTQPRSYVAEAYQPDAA